MALSTGLVMYYSLGEASGTLLDSHGGQDLTESSAIASATGKVGNCRDFEAGSTQYAERASSSTSQMGDIEVTICAWVNLESLGTLRTVLGKSGASNFEYDIQFDPAAGGQWRFRAASSAAFGGLTSAIKVGAPSTATWYFLTCQHDPTANTIGIGINAGALTTASFSGGIYVGTDSLRMGNNAYGEYWDGLIDEVGVWKRLLSGSEITELYNSGNGRDYAYITGGAAQDTPELYGRPEGLRGGRQLAQLLCT